MTKRSQHGGQVAGAVALTIAPPGELQQYYAPAGGLGPQFVFLDNNYVNPQNGQEGKGKKAGFPVRDAAKFALFNGATKLGNIQAAREAGTSGFHVIVVTLAAGSTNPGGVQGINFMYAPITAAAAAAPATTTLASVPTTIVRSGATLPMTITLSAPPSVSAGRSFTVTATGDWTSPSGGVWTLNGTAVTAPPPGTSCVFTAPATVGRATVTYTLNGLMATATLDVTPRVAGGGRRRKTQRRRNGSRRH